MKLEVVFYKFVVKNDELGKIKFKSWVMVSLKSVKIKILQFYWGSLSDDFSWQRLLTQNVKLLTLLNHPKLKLYSRTLTIISLSAQNGLIELRIWWERSFYEHSFELLYVERNFCFFRSLINNEFMFLLGILYFLRFQKMMWNFVDLLGEALGFLLENLWDFIKMKRLMIWGGGERLFGE